MVSQHNEQVIAVAKLFDGEQWHHNVQVHVSNGKIAAISPADKGLVTNVALVPGFIV